MTTQPYAREWKNPENAIAFAIACAKAALPVWERAYPDDHRPRKAIEAAETGDPIDAERAASDACGAVAQTVNRPGTIAGTPVPVVSSPTVFAAALSAEAAARAVYAEARVGHAAADAANTTRSADPTIDVDRIFATWVARDLNVDVDYVLALIKADALGSLA